MQRSNVRRFGSRSTIAATCALAVAASIVGCKAEDNDAPAAKAVSQAVTQAPGAPPPAFVRQPPPMPPSLPAPTGTEHPRPFDIELINYAGWRKDGVMFDRSGGKKPYSINLNQVVPGWAEGLQLMVVGEKRRMWIPAKLAFGDTQRPSGYAPVSGDIVVDVELVKIDTSQRAVAMRLAQEQATQPPASIADKPQ
jgi:hypothetical protein